MDTIINSLRKSSQLSLVQLEALDSICGINRDLIQRQLRMKKSKKILPYSGDLKAFALTLHYYSPAAYRFVRDSFDSCLPHPDHLKKWYTKIDGSPQFTEESFKAIKSVTAKSNKPILVNLVFDEMAIKKQRSR